MPIHDLRERLDFSEGIEIEEDIVIAMRRIIPGCERIIRANTSEDRQGTDYWAIRKRYTGHPPLRWISFDVKHRSYCPIEKWKSDDACIEYCSVHRNGECQSPGWTIDERKRTDYIVYTWPYGVNGRRYWIVPYHPLNIAAQINLGQWMQIYKTGKADNEGYVTLSVYPPRRVIAKAMKELMYGTTD